jgi:hypothetical protein
MKEQEGRDKEPEMTRNRQCGNTASAAAGLGAALEKQEKEAREAKAGSGDRTPMSSVFDCF